MRLAASVLAGIVVGAIVFGGEAAVAAPLLLTTKTLSMKDHVDPMRLKLTLGSKDDALGIGAGNGSLDDPTLAGATLRVRTTAGCDGPCDATYVLPAEGWRLIGAPGDDEGYQYTDRLLVAGPVKKASLRTGKVLKIIAQGDQLMHRLPTDPLPVDVVLTLGTQQACFQSGGTTVFKAGRKLTASNAPAPGACP